VKIFHSVKRNVHTESTGEFRLTLDAAAGSLNFGLG